MQWPVRQKVRTFKVEIVAPPQLSFQPTSPKMPPRVARSSIQTGGASSFKGQSKHRNPKKAQKRALDAFSIAQHENPDDAKVRKNRLGEFDPAFNRKRARDDDDEEDEEDEDEDDGPKRRKRRSGDESFDEGSDSEGNTWQMGHVDNDDDDESIDSDEAFGESDEERFEGYTFRGSSKRKRQEWHRNLQSLPL